MKLVKIGLLAVVCVAAGGVAWYRTSAAIAEGHECGAHAGAVSHAKDKALAKGDAAATPTTKPEPANKGDADVIAQQKPRYPLNTCVVLGNKLGEHGEPVDYVYKGRLVRFCCKGCIATFEKEPAKYLAKIDEANKSKEKEKVGSTDSKPSSKAGQAPHTEHSHH